MKILLVSIDSKYIHTNMAVRYLKANLDFDSEILEFTIKDSFEKIEKTIMDQVPNIVAFSVYLWNVQLIIKLIESIKSKSETIIIIGGPEVSYEPEYYMLNSKTDFLIAGEGEIAFRELINAIINRSSFHSIKGLSYRENDMNICKKPTMIENLNSLKDPYLLENNSSILSSKIQYVETSRGCPYQCSYCLASLENKVRFFDLNRVKSDILHLMKSGAKTYKFLDRTFNYKIDHSLELFRFLIENHQEGTQFQFEITGDLLPIELINLLNAEAPKGLFRFEIGIQSTNEITNLSVNRHQNNDKLFNNIRLIQSAGIIDLHLDLIAGLPMENLSRFEQTFNEVFDLRAKELQLGFLKMLRGTKIRDQALKYDYKYDEFPPYEIFSSQSLSKEDIKEIHLVESSLDLYWNKGYMPSTMLYIMEAQNSPFQFFNQIGHYLQSISFDFHRFQLSDLFFNLNEYIQKSNFKNHRDIFDLLKYEYLMRSNIKPKIWWDKTNEKIFRNAILKDFHYLHPELKIDDLYKYSVVTKYHSGYLIVVYFPGGKSVFEY
jgi:radical SAM superfamily enzyme YgiQ (UPF0313 family)